MDIKAAHDALKEHATKNHDRRLEAALHEFAVKQQWEEPTAKEYAQKIRL